MSTVPAQVDPSACRDRLADSPRCATAVVACAALAAASLFALAPGASAAEIWTGPRIDFSKEAGADWTLPENQDRITDNVWLTRQDTKPLYNIKWWLDNEGADPANNTVGQDFFLSGGTRGVKWAILSDAGAGVDGDPGMQQWDQFEHYGQLGDPTNFMSFHDMLAILLNLENGIGPIDPDEIGQFDTAFPPHLIGQDLGLWLVEDDVYLEITFTHWGQGNGGFAYNRTTIPGPGGLALLLAIALAPGARRRRH
jgi:hypothetical protein